MVSRVIFKSLEMHVDNDKQKKILSGPRVIDFYDEHDVFCCAFPLFPSARKFIGVGLEKSRCNCCKR